MERLESTIKDQIIAKFLKAKQEISLFMNVVNQMVWFQE